MEREQPKVEEKICNRRLQGFRKVRRTQSSKGKKKCHGKEGRFMDSDHGR